jgi:hypothetical protein
MMRRDCRIVNNSFDSLPRASAQDRGSGDPLAPLALSEGALVVLPL